MYERASFIQPRMAGSREMCNTSATKWPALALGTGVRLMSQSDATGRPFGLAARHTCMFLSVMSDTAHYSIYSNNQDDARLFVNAKQLM
jgi:hypothetical protein